MLTEGSFTSQRHGDDIHTYCWSNPGAQEPCGTVFLLHGLHGATLHEYYAIGETPTYDGSLVQKLLDANLKVYANDHRGHGRSGGLPAYFSVDELAADSLEFIERVNSKSPVFLVGVSMGGTVSLMLIKARPDLFTGAVLVSPAVTEPESGFGMLVAIFSAVSVVVAAIAPRAEILKLPPIPVPALCDYFVHDPECYQGKLRARSGRSMLEAYRELDVSKNQILTPLVVFIGTEDDLVGPKGVQEFFSNLPIKDKTLRVCTGKWHTLFNEDGGDLIQDEALKWIVDRATKMA